MQRTRVALCTRHVQIPVIYSYIYIIYICIFTCIDIFIFAHAAYTGGPLYSPCGNPKCHKVEPEPVPILSKSQLHFLQKTELKTNFCRLISNGHQVAVEPVQILKTIQIYIDSFYQIVFCI